MLRAFICLAWFLSHSILRISLWCRYYCYSPYYIGASLVAHRVKNLPAMQETWFNPCVGKIPWGRGWLPIPVFLPGEFHGQRSLAGYSPQGHKESDTTEWRTLALVWASQAALAVKNPPANAGDIRTQVWYLGQEGPLEEGITTDSIFWGQKG